MKTVLITGSSRGIGAETAEVFAENGYKVVLNCLNSPDLMDNVVNRINNKGGTAMGLKADVSDYAQVKGMFDRINSAFGAVDVLINNAGISHVGLFSQMVPEEWDKIFSVNLYSVLNCCHAAIPAMVSEKRGVIINISSIWGISGASCEAAYSAAKGGVNIFTKALAKELGPSGIRVNAIACGVMETGMNEWLSDHEKEALIDSIPASRFGQPREAAYLALFLASDRAKYITGEIIRLDGGFI